MEECPPPVTNACYAGTLRQASRRLTQLYDHALAPSGLRSTQYAILAALFFACPEPPTVNELSDIMVIDRSGLGHSLRLLERDGLIELTSDSRDRRSTLIVLSEKGRHRYHEATELWQRAQDHYRAVVGSAEADHLRELLSTIANDDRLAASALRPFAREPSQ